MSFSSNDTGPGFGLQGISVNKTGVLGQSTNGAGVFGSSVGGEGVHGEAQGGSAAVGAINRGPGPAVFGIAQTGEAVHGETTSGTFAAIAGTNNGSGAGVFGLSRSGEGVHGEADGSSAAVGAINKGLLGPAVFGIAQGGQGVHGETKSATAAGVAGINNGPAGVGNPSGVFGKSQSGEGVHGETSSGTFAAVAGINSGPAGVGNPSGVFGHSDNGEGVHGETNSPGFAAVAGLHLNTNPSATGAGVFGQSAGSGPGGVFTTNGGNLLPVGLGDAVFAISGPTGSAIHGVGGTNAGLFDGHVQINGGLDVTGEFTCPSKHFLIDHPCDPANKYLLHCSVEAPEMINIYCGNVITDEAGTATVLLPNYFEALNCDFRYQLTVIGQFSQAIIAEEIANNRFVIKTNQPHVKVSWQVVGVRQDAYAKAHPVVVERDKPSAEKGRYSQPLLDN